MGKVIEKVKLTSLFNPKKSVEAEAIIDTGARMILSMPFACKTYVIEEA